MQAYRVTSEPTSSVLPAVYSVKWRTIGEWWIGNSTKGSRHGFIYDTMQTFTCIIWRNPWESSTTRVSVVAKIWTQHIPNTSWKCDLLSLLAWSVCADITVILQWSEVKQSCPPCLIKHHAMKMHGAAKYCSTIVNLSTIRQLSGQLHIPATTSRAECPWSQSGSYEDGKTPVSLPGEKKR
jgi:hypothetical protein